MTDETDDETDIAASTAPQQPKVRGRPFPKGVSGNPAGRKVGSRNRLADSYLNDLNDCWQRNGVAALDAVAKNQPEVLVKVIASLLPKTIDINQTIGVNPADVLATFRLAVAQLGNAAPRSLPSAKVIDGKP